VWPQACRHNPGKHHVKPVRQRWFGCACCPPNIARLIASLGSYVYDVDAEAGVIYTHLYIGGEAALEVGGGSVVVRQETNYPWDGAVKLTVNPSAAGHDAEAATPGAPAGNGASAGPAHGVSADAGVPETAPSAAFTLALRLPGWSRTAELYVNGERFSPDVRDGYAYVSRVWQPGDTIELKLDMSIRLLQAHPEVRADAGRVAIQRGPLVYCLEEADNPGGPLSALAINTLTPLAASYDAQLLGGCVTIEGRAFREGARDWSDALYLPLDTAANDRAGAAGDANDGAGAAGAAAGTASGASDGSEATAAAATIATAAGTAAADATAAGTAAAATTVAGTADAANYARSEQLVSFRAIPYFLWGNRGEGEMTVWVRYR
jgi:hypothetical protein